jgi:hypothetical protein
MPVLIVMPIAAGVVIHTERSPAPTQAKVPTAPRVVVDIKTPGADTGIVIVG